jgi:hypothetical protein
VVFEPSKNRPCIDEWREYVQIVYLHRRKSGAKFCIDCVITEIYYDFEVQILLSIIFTVTW